MTPGHGSAGTRLRTLLHAGDTGPLLAPGCFDALSARLVEEAGFRVAHVSGAAVSAVSLGLPDLGFVGATDMVEAVSRISAAASVPLIADADAGYGGPAQTARTVHRYELAGAAALHVEDQVLPKRCGHMAGKAIVPMAEAVARVEAAVGARRDIVVIARTDALSVAGADEAVRRAGAFAACGADAVFVEGALDQATADRVRAAAPGLPLVLNASESGTADPAPAGAHAALGARVVLSPVAPLLAAARAMRATLHTLRTTGSAAGSTRMPWDELTDLLGLPECASLEERLAPRPPGPFDTTRS
ncbi:isocitrate lyase/PEP mutase family protein [Nocardiopsis quinghaiensis]|uniref:isocitrate lyase/PEP mutase family protein n=1 Tax=Nocardiopsis quinghaiensis TaxID=464995 RepID=UPI00123919A6|nr:isocitrate lyase/PEP mutase family protein [Nocardiopsis quinghaiensis]